MTHRADHGQWNEEWNGGETDADQPAPPVERAETPEREHLRATVSQVAGNLRTLAYGANSPKNEALRRYAVALDQALAALPPPAREPETPTVEQLETMRRAGKMLRCSPECNANFAATDGSSQSCSCGAFAANFYLNWAADRLAEYLTISALPTPPDRDARDAVITLLEEAIEPALNSGCIGPARAYVQEALALLRAEAKE